MMLTQVFVHFLPAEYIGIADACVSAVAIAPCFVTTLPISEK